MSWDAIDWGSLEQMRAAFLSGTAGAADYWQSEAQLAAYDATFAQRIGWKWDYVLAELTRRGWLPPTGELLDWGCGSGIAGRAFLDHFGSQSVAAVRVWDRSPLAMQFAANRARGKYPGLKVNTGLEIPIEERTDSPSPAPGSGGSKGAHGATAPAFTLLLSHVLTELTPDQTESLLHLAIRAQCVLWVEPGTYEVSRRLIALRERLQDHLNVIAPCTHSASCGMLVSGNKRHWCHHFAAPPREIFTDGNWSRFARLTGIDLRDLPLSFLVLDERPPPLLPPGTGRVIGHPRIYKAHALLLGCDATGVRERKLSQRTLPAEFRALKKSATDVVRVWTTAGDEIVTFKSVSEAGKTPRSDRSGVNRAKENPFRLPGRGF